MYNSNTPQNVAQAAVSIIQQLKPSNKYEII